ncbi:MAG TPA: rhodanese-like domain-containing protein [Steroidobacteraceae bacterium]|nr:rhodanese-like domain-containing protein [Steroidobacteraceae bacterium]
MNRVLAFAATSLFAFASLAIADTQPALIAPDQLVEKMEKKDKDLVLLDVRTPEEFAAGHIPGAINMPHDQLPNRLAEIAGAKNKDVVVYCRTGRRSAIAQETLTAQGFKSVRHLEGDMVKWQEEKRATTK